MTFSENVVQEVLKSVEVPENLLKFIYLLLLREERDNFPSILGFPKLPKSSYANIYALVIINLLQNTHKFSKYGLNMSLGTASFSGLNKDLPFRYGTFYTDLTSYSVRVRFGQSLRRKHTYILGDTGSGKTQLIQQMILSDLDTNASIVVIDSQGDLINKLKRSKEIDPEKLVVIDPVDSVLYPLALNMFDVKERADPVEQERHLNGVVELLNFVFSSVMESSLTDKQSVLFNFCIRLLINNRGSTLHDFVDILEKGVDGFSLDGLPDVAQKFFRESYNGREFNHTRQEVLRRLYFLLENPTISRIFKAPKNLLDMSKEMDAGKIILISTDRSLLKRQGCSFFGRYFLSLISQAMQDRLNWSEHQRRKAYVYIDECGDYLNSSDVNITDILEKGRKYNVSLTLSHQQIQQLPVDVFQSIRTNTAIKFVGSCSPNDARTLKEDMSCQYLNRPPHLRFMCHTKGSHQSYYIKVDVGLLEGTEQRSDAELEVLMVENRAKYCVLPTKSAPATEINEEKPTSPDNDIDYFLKS